MRARLEVKVHHRVTKDKGRVSLGLTLTHNPNEGTIRSRGAWSGYRGYLEDGCIAPATNNFIKK